MRYTHRFRVRAGQAAVAEFHRRAASLAAITPPPLRVVVHHAPDPLGEGDEMDFSLGLGPLLIRWRARIEDVSGAGFSDCQLQGPFRAWRHRHTFVALDDTMTEVVDEIEALLRRHPVWGAVGLGMWLGLPFLFAFRAARTRQQLERTSR